VAFPLVGALGAHQVVTDKYATNTTSRLDEESFTRLLAAAYVMQEHQDRMMAKLPAADFTQVISQIVETQHVIQTRKLEMDAALELIASRLQKLTGAAGATIGLLEQDELEYRAACGCVSGLAGSVVRPETSLSALCLRSGEKLRSPIVEADPRLNASLRRALRARSLLAVPVFYEAKVAGSVELFFAETSAFSESDVRASELMAGLVTEVMAQASETKLKQELASERASVLMALEKLKPQLERLTNEQTALIERAAAAPVEAVTCKACGGSIHSGATTCPVCGAMKDTGKYPGTELQSKWAAMWDRQKDEDLEEPPTFQSRESFPSSSLASEADSRVDHKSNGSPAVHEDLPAWPTGLSETRTLSESKDNFWEIDEEQPEHMMSVAATGPETDDALATKDSEPVLSGEAEYEPESVNPPLETVSLGDFAQNTKEWIRTKLDQTPGGKRVYELWVLRRGDISLAIAGGVVAVALLWGFWPSHTAKSQAATTSVATVANNPSVPAQPSVAERKRRLKPPAPELTTWEKVLVGLGLAEPPPAPAYMGDPNVKVWVDLQSALYYCPSADLYGKTSKGKFTTQGDAQLDQFEPALRRPCD